MSGQLKQLTTDLLAAKKAINELKKELDDAEENEKEEIKERLTEAEKEKEAIGKTVIEWLETEEESTNPDPFHNSANRSSQLDAPSTSFYSLLRSGPTHNTGVNFMGEDIDDTTLKNWFLL